MSKDSEIDPTLAVDDMPFDERSFKFEMLTIVSIAIASLLASVVMVAVVFVISPDGKLATWQVLVLILFMVIDIWMMLVLASRSVEAAWILGGRRYSIKFGREERRELVELLKQFSHEESKKLMRQLALLHVTTDIHAKTQAELGELGVTDDVYQLDDSIRASYNKYGRARVFFQDAGIYFPDNPRTFLEKGDSEPMH